MSKSTRSAVQSAAVSRPPAWRRTVGFRRRLLPSGENTPSRRRQPAVVPPMLAIALLASLAGCSGSATVQFVSLHPSEIDPPHTAVWRLDAQECYWWIDEAGELNVAMTCKRRDPLLGQYGRADFDVSFALGDPPAGSGRNYQVQQREVRTLFLSAMATLRLTAQLGIVGVTVGKDGTIRGSFRMWMTPQGELQVLSLLPEQIGPLLCFGTFRAVQDQARGQQIKARCESGGWTRPPRRPPAPTTQPAATQPAGT